MFEFIIVLLPLFLVFIGLMVILQLCTSGTMDLGTGGWCAGGDQDPDRNAAAAGSPGRIVLPWSRRLRPVWIFPSTSWKPTTWRR